MLIFRKRPIGNLPKKCKSKTPFWKRKNAVIRNNWNRNGKIESWLSDWLKRAMDRSRIVLHWLESEYFL